MVKAYNPDARRPYVLKCDRGLLPPEQTTFFIRPLSMQDDFDIEDLTAGLFKEEPAPAPAPQDTSEAAAQGGLTPAAPIRRVTRGNFLEYARVVLSRSLVGWDNLVDGPAFELDAAGRITDACWLAIHRHASELLSAVRAEEEVTAADVGKS